MRIRAIVTVIIGLGLTMSPLAADALNKEQEKCQATIAKEAGKYMKAHLKERAKCADKNLKATGSCDFVKRDQKLAKAETKLRSGLQKKCGDAFPTGFDDENLAILGFPGKCADADPSNGFNVSDLGDCIFDTHESYAEAIIDLQYGANADDGVIDFETRTGDAVLAKDLGKCQKEVGKNGAKFLTTIQKEITKCRDGLLKTPPKFSGFLATACGDNPIEPKPGEKIAKAETKLKDKITGKCTDALIAAPEMDVCDVGSGPQSTATAAADCIADATRNGTDDPDNSGTATPFPLDIVDIEYALGAVCGDNIVNDPAVPRTTGSFFVGAPPEECDGVDDAACPGECGAPGGNFPCLCKDRLRDRVIEHDNMDLDNGWTGTSHDSSIVEGGGYVIELRDCDGPGGPDVLCTSGPSCDLPPNQACASDADCAGGGNFCRKSPLATGPHCQNDVQMPCDTDSDCSGVGNFCRKRPHGIPLPLSAGGIAVCVVNVFSEDVAGTVNLVTGDGAARLRQRAITHLASGTLTQPCPTCGGFCAGVSGGVGPGARTLCSADSDCPASVTCVTDAVCSHGPNEDQACRRTPPFGNDTVLFGTPSVDCPPSSGSDISSGGLDILFNPTTTGSVTVLPSSTCSAAGFGGNKCIFGSEIGKTCVADSDCAGGGAGSCAPQCFCPSVGGAPQKPNDCDAACHGGTNDYASCGADSDCPGGLCEASSCRLAAGVCTGGTMVGTACGADSDCVDGPCGDADSNGEGFCPGGPAIGICSFTTLKGCVTDSECRPSGSCSFCKSDDSETCEFKNKDCFPSAGFSRIGAPGVPDRISVTHFCIPASGSSALNNTAGLPGPGAIQQPATIITNVP